LTILHSSVRRKDANGISPYKRDGSKQQEQLTVALEPIIGMLAMLNRSNVWLGNTVKYKI
jgi:hypothetical protein